MESRIGTRADGDELEESLRQLGARLLPPEPRARDGAPLVYEIAAARRLSPETTEPERVEALAAAYRAVLAHRFSIRSKYMINNALDSHAHFRRLAELGAEMVDQKIAPLAWVIFSFDQWSSSPKRRSVRSPPTAKWVWSKKRWREQRALFLEERYAGVELRAAPEAAALYVDWRLMWVELMQQAPTTREGVAAIVEKWFPGDSYDRRLSRARVQTWEAQDRVNRQLAAGGWPWD